MRRLWDGLRLLPAVLAGLAGCATPDITRPPKPPEEYGPPPVEEARFSMPPQYPKETLNQDAIPKPSTTPGGLGGPGGMGGMGGMNGMSGGRSGGTSGRGY
jgi:hypothetical protein